MITDTRKRINIECALVSRWLEPFFDGELGRFRRTLVKSHSARCPTCQARLKEMEGLRAALRQATTLAHEPADFGEMWAQLSSRLPHSTDVFPSRQWFGWLQRLVPQRPVWASAALALVAAAAIGIFWQTRSTAPDVSNAVIIDYMESRHSSVMIVQPQHPGDMTVIWLFEEMKKGPPA